MTVEAQAHAPDRSAGDGQVVGAGHEALGAWALAGGLGFENGGPLEVDSARAGRRDRWRAAEEVERHRVEAAVGVLERKGATAERSALMVEQLERNPRGSYRGRGADGRRDGILANGREAAGRRWRLLEGDQGAIDERTDQATQHLVVVGPRGRAEPGGEPNEGVSRLQIAEHFGDRLARGRLGPPQARVGGDDEEGGAVIRGDGGETGPGAAHRDTPLPTDRTRAPTRAPLPPQAGQERPPVPAQTRRTT